MLNILKKKCKNTFNDTPLNNYNIKKQDVKIQNNLWKNEYKNIIYYPYAVKEWSNSAYYYNIPYVKLLIIYNLRVNNIFNNYLNMFKDKIKIFFKRRRTNKIRYSADKIYVSRAEVNHTNTKLIVFFYTYNKAKSSIEVYTTKIINLKKKIFSSMRGKKKIIYKNKLLPELKQVFFYFKKFNILFFIIKNNIFKYVACKKKMYIKSDKIY